MNRVAHGFVRIRDVTPPDGPRIKDEPGTVVWRETRDGVPVVLKLYRRRGAAAALGASCRARREHAALARLAAAGVPCTEPVAWSRGRSSAHGRWELLITREVAGAESLRVWLGTRALDPATLPLERLFSVIGAMHASGVFHGALWSSNVLFDGRLFRVGDLGRAVLLGRGIRGGALARADLLDFCYSLRTLGVDPARMPLGHAGVTAAAAARLRERLAGYRPGKRLRQAARARALLLRWLGGGATDVR